MNETFWSDNVKYTNRHAELEGDGDFIPIPENEAGQALLRAFFVITAETAARNIPVNDVWKQGYGYGISWLANTMTKPRYWQIRKHFKMTDTEDADPEDAFSFIKEGVDYLRDQCRLFWVLGEITSADEGRSTSRSIFNLYTVFNQAKLTRLGWEWIELCDRGRFVMGFCWDYLILFGSRQRRMRPQSDINTSRL